ncbi:hypothetical protein PENTCL1PPCAC_23649, partial [Pristionchus entomophagus]
PVPTALIETISIRVCPKQRLGLNIRQSDNRTFCITDSSPVHNKMCVGDRLLKINGKPFDVTRVLKCPIPLSYPNHSNFQSTTPHKKPRCSQEPLEDGHTPVTTKLTVERAVFSWSRLELTTLEKYDLPKKYDKNEEEFTGRPIKWYTVVLRRPHLSGLECAPLGLSLRYDSRERVTVANTLKGSVARTHLKPGDIIKQ